MGVVKTRFQFRERYFFLGVLPIAIAIEWAFSSTLNWQAYPRSEWVVLIDLCLFLPLLYLGCFSSHLERNPRLIRTFGLVGLGVLAARYIVPEANQLAISHLSQMRNALLGIVILFEAFVFYKLIQALYQDGADTKKLERDFALPVWVAKLLILEARFWQAVWRFFKRK